MYEYKVKEIIKIYDGDTITVKLSHGFNIESTQTFRLLGIDTPELRGEEREAGLVSRDYLRKVLNEAMVEDGIMIKTYKDKKGKYGRYLAEVFVNNININKELLDLGLAEIYGK